jgi:serine/threonine-protein kinase
VKTCPTCSATYGDNEAFCSKDGAALRSQTGFEPGAVIRDKYQIVSEIGRGGMAVVFRARHLLWNEDKALKIMLNPEQAGIQVKAFLSEAMVMRQLKHPNVVAVEDADYTEDRRPFVVMEYVEGENLRQRIQRAGVLEPEVALDLTAQACSALDVAHQRGIIHRDIKPQNLLLTAKPGGGDLLKVIDFGIAKVREDAGLGFTGMVTGTTGMFVGTPEYASPEQASGQRGSELDGRTDIYSLGLVLYEMLTGDLPFRAETPIAVLVQRLQVKPTPPHLARPELKIPDHVSAIVMKSLATDRTVRYGSAKDMAAEIAATLAALNAEHERRAREEAERVREQERIAREEERIERAKAEAARQAELRERERIALERKERVITSPVASSVNQSLAQQKHVPPPVLEPKDETTHRVLKPSRQSLLTAAAALIFVAVVAERVWPYLASTKAPTGPRPASAPSAAMREPSPSPGSRRLAQPTDHVPDSATSPSKPTSKAPSAEFGTTSSPANPPATKASRTFVHSVPEEAKAPELDAVPKMSNQLRHAGDTKINQKDGLIYVWIPPGTFMMGCSSGDGECGGPAAHKVTLTKGYWMGQTEVTQEAYEKVAGSNPSTFKGRHLPVEMVSWNEAQAYCGKIGMRLPTEAEWEYAARAGNADSRYGALDAVGWYQSNSGGKTHEVSSKQINAFGLYDMLGNVWEWVADWYGSYPAGPVSDPLGPPTGQLRVLRGGSWDYPPTYARASARYWDPPGYRYNNFGFRCVGE